MHIKYTAHIYIHTYDKDMHTYAHDVAICLRVYVFASP